MSTEQLLQEKKSILHQLESSNDNELLHEIYLLLESRNTQLENPFSQDELIERIKLSETDIQNGNTISFAELKELTKKWHEDSNH
jgi:hypothetical protein